MHLEGNPFIVIWILWLLLDWLLCVVIAIRQFQLWHLAPKGRKLPGLLVFLIMSGWAVGGFLWFLTSLEVVGSTKAMVLMLLARTVGSIPILLWGGMLVGIVKEKSVPVLERTISSGEQSVDYWQQIIKEGVDYERIRQIVREEIDLL